MLRKDILKSSISSADLKEIEKFNLLAEEWWKPKGAFKVIHAFNSVRVHYLHSSLSRLVCHNQDTAIPFQGLRILDAGCGAGLVSEPMARLGAHVTGIDASEQNIKIARYHASTSGVDIKYNHTLPENMDPQTDGLFDIVLSLEVVEHVGNLQTFIYALARLVKPKGYLVIGTLNRTFSSYIKAIFGAEYIFRLLPRGTHDWNKFVTPEELDTLLKPHGFSRVEICGLTFQPFTRTWKTTNDVSVNYLLIHQKV